LRFQDTQALILPIAPGQIEEIFAHHCAAILALNVRTDPPRAACSFDEDFFVDPPETASGTCKDCGARNLAQVIAMNPPANESSSSLKQPSGWEVPDRPLNDLLAVWLAGLVLFLATGTPAIGASPPANSPSCHSNPTDSYQLQETRPESISIPSGSD
jgi:hypothetical protein